LNKLTSVEDNLVANNLTVFPNPSSNILNLNFDNNSNMDLSNIKIYSLFGHEIHLNVISISENNVELDISTLPYGVYFVNVQFGEKLERIKFVKL
jgi:hypothetical protein